MRARGGIQFPPAAIPVMGPQQPNLMINGGPLMNDAQLIILSAALSGIEDPKEAIKYAQDLFVEGLSNMGRIGQLVAKLQADEAAAKSTGVQEYKSTIEAPPG